MTNSKQLQGQVALVTGSSRGAGRGIALALGEAGATVYVTGRSTRAQSTQADLTGTIEDTADELTARGGGGIAIRIHGISVFRSFPLPPKLNRTHTVSKSHVRLQKSNLDRPSFRHRRTSQYTLKQLMMNFRKRLSPFQMLAIERDIVGILRKTLAKCLPIVLIPRRLQ